MIKKCYICGKNELKERDGKVRDSENLKVLQCSFCETITLSDFSHIKDDCYENEKMYERDDIKDIEGLLEQAKLDDDRRYDFFKDVLKGKDVLDFGSGAGGFLFRNKKNCKSLYGIELERRMRDYSLSNGIKCFRDLEELVKKNIKVDYITLFHTLEHIKQPIELLDSFKGVLRENGKIIIEVPNANDALLSIYKNKAFADFTFWSYHLYTFSSTSFKIMAKKLNYKITNIEYVQRYSLANHLYWLSNGKPSGQIFYRELDNKNLNEEYKKVLTKSESCDTLTIEMEI